MRKLDLSDSGLVLGNLNVKLPRDLIDRVNYSCQLRSSEERVVINQARVVADLIEQHLAARPSAPENLNGAGQKAAPAVKKKPQHPVGRVKRAPAVA